MINSINKNRATNMIIIHIKHMQAILTFKKSKRAFLRYVKCLTAAHFMAPGCAVLRLN